MSLRLVKEKKLPLFTVKKYEGYGYEISAVIEDDRTEIKANPTKDILLQPEIVFNYLDGELRADLYFGKVLITDKNIKKFISYISDAEVLIREVMKLKL